MTLIHDPWFSVRQMEKGVTIIEEPFHVERVKSYLIEGSERSVLIDTGMGVADLRGLVEQITDRPILVVNSHAHWDHVGGNRQFEEVWIHEAEADKLAEGIGNTKLRNGFQPQFLTGSLPSSVDLETLVFPPSHANRRLVDGDVVELGDRVLEVLHCPGHSIGGIALLDRANRILVTTDVAYAGELYVYSPEDLSIYQASLARLAALIPDIDVAYPSHNESPFPPSMIQAMADGVRAIIDGLPPLGQQGDATKHQFDGFSVVTFGNLT